MENHNSKVEMCQCGAGGAAAANPGNVGAMADPDAGVPPPSDELDKMKPERIQGPSAITLTWTVAGDRLGTNALLALAQARVNTAAQPAFLQVRQQVQYRLFASLRLFLSRLIDRARPAEKPILAELQVLADPGKATEAADLIKSLTRLANGQI